MEVRTDTNPPFNRLFSRRQSQDGLGGENGSAKAPFWGTGWWGQAVRLSGSSPKIEYKAAVTICHFNSDARIRALEGRGLKRSTGRVWNSQVWS